MSSHPGTDKYFQTASIFLPSGWCSFLFSSPTCPGKKKEAVCQGDMILAISSRKLYVTPTYTIRLHGNISLLGSRSALASESVVKYYSKVATHTHKWVYLFSARRGVQIRCLQQAILVVVAFNWVILRTNLFCMRMCLCILVCVCAHGCTCVFLCVFSVSVNVKCILPQPALKMLLTFDSLFFLQLHSPRPIRRCRHQALSCSHQQTLQRWYCSTLGIQRSVIDYRE